MPDPKEPEEKTEAPKQAGGSVTAETKTDEELTDEQLDDVAGAGWHLVTGSSGDS